MFLAVLPGTAMLIALAFHSIRLDADEMPLGTRVVVLHPEGTEVLSVDGENRYTIELGELLRIEQPYLIDTLCDGTARQR